MNCSWEVGSGSQDPAEGRDPLEPLQTEQPPSGQFWGVHTQGSRSGPDRCSFITALWEDPAFLSFCSPQPLSPTPFLWRFLPDLEAPKWEPQHLKER